MSLEKKVLELSRLYDEITRKMPKIEGKTFKKEDIYIDFAHYLNCNFENCNIIIEYGIFRLINNTFTRCIFIAKAGSPAETLLKINKDLRESTISNKSRKHIEDNSMKVTNSEIPPGKYSKWCERRPLACDDKDRYSKASRHLQKKDLTSIEKNVMFVHDLVGCQGIEFVVFSSAKFKKKINLPDNIILVPCFLPEIAGKSWKDPLVRLSSSMIFKARFVYDGWIPIKDWNIENVREVIRKIDQNLTLFSLQERISIIWEPKYMVLKDSPSSHNIEDKHIIEIEKLHEYLDSLNPEDSKAFYKSVAWLSQSLTLPSSPSRFLLCFVAIESLVNYIENEANEKSVFFSLKTLEKLEKEEMEKCIVSILDDIYSYNKIKAIETSFYDCIYLSKTKMLKSHLNRIFKIYKKPIKLLFDTKIEGKTLYDLRHMIAHGGLDALSDLQRQTVNNRIWDIENMARKYLVNILKLIIGKNPFIEKMIKAVAFGVSVASREEQYKGPIHMAEIYT